MSDFESRSAAEPADPDVEAPARKRPKPGERRVQILQALAAMLEQPGGERITTAAFGRSAGGERGGSVPSLCEQGTDVRGLDRVHRTIGVLADQPDHDHDTGAGDGRQQVARIVAMLLQFGEKNPGMARVMVGDALVFENERLQQRMNLFFDKIESVLRQSLRDGALGEGSSTPGLDAQVQAVVLTAFVVGQLQRFTRSGFRRVPTDKLDACLSRMLFIA
jgi:TetR/AcrR family transcriptional regulator